MEDEDISLGLNSNEELVSVQGQDGQQYVVLEVIQLEVKCLALRRGNVPLIRSLSIREKAVMRKMTQEWKLMVSQMAPLEAVQ